MVRWREAMMVVMRLRVEWISLVWNGKDIFSGERERGGGRGVGMEDEVRCGEAGCRADQTKPCCGVWLAWGTHWILSNDIDLILHRPEETFGRKKARMDIDIEDR
jgi:hypothetical protein